MFPSRYWLCYEQTHGYTVVLLVGNTSATEFIDRAHWDNFLYKPDLFRCVIQRLQRKMFYAIFPTHLGRFTCDLEL